MLQYSSDITYTGRLYHPIDLKLFLNEGKNGFGRDYPLSVVYRNQTEVWEQEVIQRLIRVVPDYQGALYELSVWY